METLSVDEMAEQLQESHSSDQYSDLSPNQVSAPDSFLIENADQLAEPDFLEVIKLGMGKSFGELALLNNKPRAATIKCLR